MSSIAVTISNLTLPDSEASCTYSSGIDCAVDLILASEVSANPAAKVMAMLAE